MKREKGNMRKRREREREREKEEREREHEKEERDRECLVNLLSGRCCVGSTFCLSTHYFLKTSFESRQTFVG